MQMKRHGATRHDFEQFVSVIRNHSARTHCSVCAEKRVCIACYTRSAAGYYSDLLLLLCIVFLFYYFGIHRIRAKYRRYGLL